VKIQGSAYTRYANLSCENLSGVAIRCGQDRPDGYGKTDGQDVKRGDITNAPIAWTADSIRQPLQFCEGAWK
jgi:hypothetical protein